MFNHYDVIRWETQRYNARLEKMYVPFSSEVKQTLAEKVGLLLSHLLGGVKGNSRQAKRETAYMGHGAVAR